MKRHLIRSCVFSAIGIALWPGASTAGAKTAAAVAGSVSATLAEEAPTDPTVDGIEIDRTTDSLQDQLRPRDVDRDFADTALVFSNNGATRTYVKCIAFNGNGIPIGRAWLGVPGLGVRFLLASDLSNGTDFIGQVQCGARRSVHGTAVFLGGGITDLPSLQPARQSGRIRFPLVAAY